MVVLVFYRRVRYGYGFRKIRLSKGKIAVVDPEDYDELSRYKWYASKQGRSYYAKRGVRGIRGVRSNISMHRVIMSTGVGKVTDHINHDSLDNRKANLRVVSVQENGWNQRKQIGRHSSRYKGVCLCRDKGKWHSRIMVSGKQIFLGSFDDEVAAARAYDAAARKYFGEYAALNLS